VDPNYVPGGNAVCDDLNCCRFDQGLPANSSAEAGYWGDYRDCDTPYHAFEDMVRQAASQSVKISIYSTIRALITLVIYHLRILHILFSPETSSITARGPLPQTPIEILSSTQ
jgi:hypothetical protein